MVERINWNKKIGDKKEKWFKKRGWSGTNLVDNKIKKGTKIIS